jgi:monovalent cation:H+ antiporter, CPA1 family
MQPIDFPLLGLLLFVSSIVAMVSRRLRLPYSVGLVTAGIGLALLPIGFDLPLTPELVFSVFLPPLIFEAAIQIPWRPFRRELPVLLVLVTVGVLLATAIVAAGMHYVVGWSWLGALFFGVLVAATDPVSVIAMFKSVRVDARLHLLVESESLLNDGVAAVVFAVLVGLAGAEAATPLGLGGSALFITGGALLAGCAVALPLLALAGRTDDHLVEISLTTLAAWGSFLLAEHFHVSGVLAALTAGMLVGNLGWMGAIADSSRGHVLAYWEYVAFLANSIIFLLIGAREAQMPLLDVIEAAGFAIVLSLAGRAATVYPIAALFRRGALRLPRAYQHVLWWGGLRGALALALALALPASIAERGEIIAVTFAVVAFSIFVQGLTMGPMMRRLGLILPQSRSEEEDAQTRPA